MAPFLTVTLDTDLTDEEFVERARFLVPRNGTSAIANVFVLAERYRPVWETDAGCELLVEMLEQMIEAIEAGEIAAVLDATMACPPYLAETLCAFVMQVFQIEADNLDAVGDAVLLCAALLTGIAGRPTDMTALLEGGDARSDLLFRAPAAAIAARFATDAAEDAPFLPKLIIWDLDDTLWAGTLADGEELQLFERRAEMIRAFNRHGVVSAICSKNDPAAARAVLERFGLWDEFVFPRIAFVPKGEVVRQIIADMQLRPANTLFIDDNPHNLKEVEFAVPGISLLDARSPECDARLQALLDGQAHVEKSRVAEYRALEAKVFARAEAASSADDFLIQSEIEACVIERMDNLEFAERIEELINRSNQLNYTSSRIEPGVARQRILDIDNYAVLSIFVWDRYGYYGLVGTAIFQFRTKVIEHFVFSCRIMHMGVEYHLIEALAERGYRMPAEQLKKPLPPQTVPAIRSRSFVEPDTRKRVLDAEAPREWRNIRLRLMADCQSGAFHHYSRNRDEADFDNNPRLFSLPMLLTGDGGEQHFPEFLVYTAATDYIDWRWLALAPQVDVAIFREAAERFVDMIERGGHQCLMFLPPQDGPLEMFELHVGCVPPRSRKLHPVLNGIWRELSAAHPDRITLIELADILSSDDMVHAHHYRPEALQRIAGLIDDWYEERQNGPSALGKLAA